MVDEEDEDDLDSNEEEDDNDEENDREELVIRNEIEWKPELDALLRFGNWLTSTRKFRMNEYCDIVGMPKNFAEELLLHLANSR